MKTNLRILSLAAFALAIPALIIVDWYYKGFGIFVMFALLTIGLACDQIIRMKYPGISVASLQKYRANRLLHLFALILFVQSPMALIFGNRLLEKLGFWLMAALICMGIVLDQIARLKFDYQIEKGEEK